MLFLWAHVYNGVESGIGWHTGRGAVPSSHYLSSEFLNATVARRAIRSVIPVAVFDELSEIVN